MTKASDNAFPSILITEGTEPSAPAAGKQRLYIDSTTHKLKRTDSSGVDVTIEAAAGAIATDTIWDAKGDLVAATGADAASRLAVGTNGQHLQADSAQATGVKWATPAWVQLYDNTLGGTATSIDTSTVLGGYNHLMGFFQGKSDRAGQVFEGVDIQFNGDTGSNYDSINNDFNGSTTVGNSDSVGATAGLLGAISAANGVANVPGAFTFEVPNYGATTFHKTYSSHGGVKYATSATNSHNAFNSGVWRSTAAITRIVVKTRNGSNFIAGTRLTVYGLL